MAVAVAVAATAADCYYCTYLLLLRLLTLLQSLHHYPCVFFGDAVSLWGAPAHEVLHARCLRAGMRHRSLRYHSHRRDGHGVRLVDGALAYIHACNGALVHWQE